jgi:hypothetical protein
MRRIVPCALTLALLPFVAGLGQQTRADFNGTWTLRDESRAPPAEAGIPSRTVLPARMRVTQTAGSVTIEDLNDEADRRQPPITFRVNELVTRDDPEGRFWSQRSRLTFDGTRMVIASEEPWEDPGTDALVTIHTLEVLSLQSRSTLRVMVRRTMRNLSQTTTLTYQRN